MPTVELLAAIPQHRNFSHRLYDRRHPLNRNVGRGEIKIVKVGEDVGVHRCNEMQKPCRRVVATIGCVSQIIQDLENA